MNSEPLTYNLAPSMCDQSFIGKRLDFHQNMDNDPLFIRESVIPKYQPFDLQMAD